MDILKLITDIESLNKNSKFELIFDATGGFVELYNTSGKGFVIGLKSLLSIFEDITNNLSKFSPYSTYEEKAWRDLGSEFYTDKAANAMSTVQTKPLFATLSKFVSIANSQLSQYSDNTITLNADNIEIVINFLHDLINVFKIDISALKTKNNLNKGREVIFENNKLRAIIFESFKFILDKYKSDNILKGYELKTATIEDRNYEGLSLPTYFNFETVLGIFTESQNNESLKSAGTLRFNEEELPITNEKYTYFTTQWNEGGERGLSLLNFNKYLGAVTDNSLKILKEDDTFKLVKLNILAHNTIYYGAPGTGKSYKVDQIIKYLNPKFYERVTFHPEYDNASFVGGYKPVSKKNDEGKDEISYSFVPQAFSSIYSRAWMDLYNPYYLVIEEINRGNCAEIFGEIFQLLDRNSEYTVSPSKELKEHFIGEFLDDKEHAGIKEGLKLPPNLHILATMNTSDQSLFPMDSAFKRRWDWEYVPICYDPKDEEGKINESYDFIIELPDGTKYRWVDFIATINKKHIQNNLSLGMDKCIGNYFVKPDSGKSITLKPFINKVIFYLWNDVFKDEDNKVFESNGSYEEFFPVATSGLKKVKELFERIELKPAAGYPLQEEEVELGKVAEGTQTLGS